MNGKYKTNYKDQEKQTVYKAILYRIFKYLDLRKVLEDKPHFLSKFKCL
jgi:hypothetical protein